MPINKCKRNIKSAPKTKYNSLTFPNNNVMLFTEFLDKWALETNG